MMDPSLALSLALMTVFLRPNWCEFPCVCGLSKQRFGHDSPAHVPVPEQVTAVSHAGR